MSSVSENMDLDINNYELTDILNLFKLPVMFDDKHLKQAKVIVLRMHPDKSNLPKEYFLFFTKAYKILYEIYKVRFPDAKKYKEDKFSYTAIIERELNQNKSKTAHSAEDREYHKSEEEAYKKIQKMDASKFNTWFNEKFDKFRLHDEEQDNGYEEWFRGASKEDNEDEDEDNDYNNGIKESQEMGGTWAERNAKIDQKKAKLRNKMALIQHNEIQTANSSGGGGGYYGLGREAPQEYSSGLFSSLQYEDLKKAHTESVIPVTLEDYDNRKKYKSTNDMQMFRDIERSKYDYSKESQTTRLDRETALQVEQDMKRAYRLAKQDENVREINKRFSSEFHQLTN
jgi:hypothetical protein